MQYYAGSFDHDQESGEDTSKPSAIVEIPSFGSRSRASLVRTLMQQHGGKLPMPQVSPTRLHSWPGTDLG